jgi:hypothetical protein
MSSPVAVTGRFRRLLLDKRMFDDHSAKAIHQAPPLAAGFYTPSKIGGFTL